MSAPWQPANNGTGKRFWFLYREATELRDRYRWSRSGRLVRYASHQTAQAAANRLNQDTE